MVPDVAGSSPVGRPISFSSGFPEHTVTTDWGFPDFDDHEGVHLFTDPASGSMP